MFHLFSYLLVCVCAYSVASVVSDSSRHCGLIRLLYPWDSPGEITGVGCYAFLQFLSAYSLFIPLKMYVSSWQELKQSFLHCPPLSDQLCSLLKRLIQDFFFLSQCHRPGNLKTSRVVFLVKNLPINAGEKRWEFSPWVGKISWRRKWQPILVFWPGASHGQRKPGGLQFIGLQRVGHD